MRQRARELTAALGPYEAYSEARRVRLAADTEEARLFAYNVELAVAELAGLSPERPDARPLRPEAPIWFLPFLDAQQAEALRRGAEWLLARLMGQPQTAAPVPAPPAEATAAPAAPGHDLTPRQIECLRWTAEGKSSWDIAQILGLSPRTVDEHLDNACRKLGVKRRAQAAVAAARAGLL